MAFRQVWMELPSGRLCNTPSDRYLDTDGMAVCIQVGHNDWMGRFSPIRYIGRMLSIHGTCCEWRRHML